jgi:acetylornithine deacetylase/succinyl-diaminopimelate desuccinylase-like protein
VIVRAPLTLLVLGAGLLSGSASAVAPGHAADQALDLAQRAIALRSVAGVGNKTRDVDALFRDAMVAAGWKAADIAITPVDDTAYLLATWKGSDPTLKPVVFSGHLDVVEADPKDWQRDPFSPVIENGYLFGRGSLDMKTSAALTVASLIELRKSGYKPRRTIIVAFSGDEETTMKTSKILADKLSGAELVINIDGGGGSLDEQTGKPTFWGWDGAEKTYIDYQLTVTDPGGHSSAPRPTNAIVEMSKALEKIGAYHFRTELNPVTKAFFEGAAKFKDARMAGAMRAFAANSKDEAAAAILRADPSQAGRISTTCVPTLVQGGHAQNALPQKVTANINCRVFPGHSREEIGHELERVIAMPNVKVADVTGDQSTVSPASPLRPDFVAAVTKAMSEAYPGVAIFPVQASGASDSMWFRAKGVDSYGASPVFVKDSDDFAHGLNERIPLSNIARGVTYYLSLIPELSK